MNERLAIVGDGLIGRSIRLAWQRRDPDARAVSVDRHDSPDALADATIVVLAAPVDVIVDLLPRLPSLAPAAALITDVGSTKRAIVAAARNAGLTSFVPGHPMAGDTASGPGAARADLFDDRSWFLLSRDVSPALLSRADTFVRALGARPVLLDDDGGEHDRVMAAVSHLPQVVATALLACAGEAVGADGLRHAGSGLRGTTRLAASAASVWAPILSTNAGEVAPLLRRLARELEEAADVLDDPRAMTDLFARAHRFTFDP